MSSTLALYRDTIRQHVVANNGIPSATFSHLFDMFAHIGGKHLAGVRVTEVLGIINENADEARAAEQVANVMARWGFTERIHQLLADRAGQIAGQVRGHLRGSSLLDFGCGDGHVAALIGSPKTITIFDVIDYRTPSVRARADLPFVSDRALIKPHSIDTLLAAAVLHHTEDPANEVAFFAQVAGRIVLLESVLSDRVPRPTQCTIDWLYNRGFHPGANIPVPGQFRTVQGWIQLFDEHGFTMSEIIDFGIDCRTVPEHHVLMVFDRED